MQSDLTFYSTFLQKEKWISKTDFIFRLKMNCDCTEEKHRCFLRFLYKMRFSQVKKAPNGNIIILV
jgi:hypothetical protein